ncbi:hypothetical protein CISEMA079M_15350 [Citrobacter sedlakii]
MGDSQGGRQILTENFQVNFRIAVINDALFFNEVTRECGAGNNVFGTAMHSETRDIRRAFDHQIEPVFIRKARGVFFHQKQMQPVALRRRLLDQIAVSVGEWVGVHYDAADFFTVVTQTG